MANPFLGGLVCCVQDLEKAEARIEALEEALRRLVNACTTAGIVVGDVTAYTTQKPRQEEVEAARRTLLSTTKDDDRED